MNILAKVAAWFKPAPGATPPAGRSFAPDSHGPRKDPPLARLRPNEITEKQRRGIQWPAAPEEQPGRADGGPDAPMTVVRDTTADAGAWASKYGNGK